VSSARLRCVRTLWTIAERPPESEARVDDRPFIVLTETKFSSRCIPVWIGTLLTRLGSKKNTCDNVLTMPSTVPW
jgi:hypothetical protein